MRTVVDVASDEFALLFEAWIAAGMACPGCSWIVVIVTPFCEVVCEFEAGRVGGCVFEVYDNQLLVVVLR